MIMFPDLDSNPIRESVLESRAKNKPPCDTVEQYAELERLCTRAHATRTIRADGIM